jgi:hypothetical protein
VSWDFRFPEPIEVPEGGALGTLRDAGSYITRLPKAQHDTTAWQTAMRCLMYAADNAAPIEFARLGMMQALYPKGEPIYDTGRKDLRWGRRKLVRDQ